MNDLPIGTCAGVVQTHIGPVILIMHQYAYLGKGKTIHSPGQMEHYGIDVNDKSLKVKGGKQRIITLDGYGIPLTFQDGFLKLPMHASNDEELDSYPHVLITSDVTWDQLCLMMIVTMMNGMMPKPIFLLKTHGERSFQ